MLFVDVAKAGTLKPIELKIVAPNKNAVILVSLIMAANKRQRS